jgi:hypothetical protein
VLVERGDHVGMSVSAVVVEDEMEILASGHPPG